MYQLTSEAKDPNNFWENEESEVKPVEVPDSVTAIFWLFSPKHKNPRWLRQSGNKMLRLHLNKHSYNIMCCCNRSRSKLGFEPGRSLPTMKRIQSEGISLSIPRWCAFWSMGFAETLLVTFQSFHPVVPRLLILGNWPFQLSSTLTMRRFIEEYGWTFMCTNQQILLHCLFQSTGRGNG